MTIIVPIDFSAQAINAASFAARMLSGVPEAELVLYHLYLEESEEAVITENLRQVKNQLLDNSDVAIRCIAENGIGLVYSLSSLITKQDASLVVMSVSDKVKFFEDSYAVQMMSESSCPVMVIPYGYPFTDVRTVAVASDFKEVDKTVPLEKVKRVLRLFQPQLHIVHVNPAIDEPLAGRLLNQQKQLNEMFREFRPEFHFITTENFAGGLDRFVTENNIDLVLTFPRKHSFLSTLIKGTNTQKLVYNYAVPVLGAHE